MSVLKTNKALFDYIQEEVRRQGHNIEQDDGHLRIAWMWEAWCFASALWVRGQMYPSVDNIAALGFFCEQHENAKGFRGVGVMVGDRRCPPAQEVPERVARLVTLTHLDPLEFYKEFELIHPFVDGNGRVGKILLNWLNNTLDAPIFPPSDFWGHETVNP